MACPKLLSLFHIGDVDLSKPSAQMRLDHPLSIANDDDNLVDKLGELFKVMRDECLIGHFEEGLWHIDGEGIRPCAFACCKDDGLHFFITLTDFARSDM